VKRELNLCAWVLVALTLTLAQAAESAESPLGIEHELARKLQASLDSTLEATGAMGVSATAIMPDGKLWVGTSGLSHPNTAITPDMKFDMGSVGKNIMAALVLDLIEDDLLSLEDPISMYLPSFPNVEGRITIRQLLSHTSGLYMWVEHADSPFNTPYIEIDSEKWWSVEELFSELGGEAYFEPGEGWHYTQAGFQLARMIVEQVTESTVPVEIQKRLLDPLGIHGMLLDLKEPVSPQARIAHNWFDADGDGIPDDISGRSRNWINSLSGIYYFSTMESLARWLRGLYDGKVLSRVSLDQMLDFHGPLPEEGLGGYGLGTEQFFLGTTEMWGHKGSIYGYRTCVYHLPQFNITVALSINSHSDEQGYALFGAIVETLLADQKPD